MKYSDFIKQFDITRGNLLRMLESVSETSADRQPAGFNNTIRWNVGHILTVTEQFIFGYPNSSSLPATYQDMFANGTKPADWTGETISLETLRTQLQDQAARIKEHIMNRLGDQLPEPLTLGPDLQLETTAEVCHLCLLHEATHTGYVQALKRIV